MTTSLIDRAWRDAFVGVMQLGGADADVIGARLAEIEAHCRDSGETAEEAFGPAEPYARSLSAALGRTRSPRQLLFGLALAMFAVGYSVVAVGASLGDSSPGPRFPWEAGPVLGLGVLGVVALVMPGLRVRGLSGRAAGRILAVALVLALALSFAWRHPLVTTPREPTMLGFIGVLVAGALLLGVISWRAAPRHPVTRATKPRDRLLALLFPVLVLMPIVTELQRLRH